jgi:beta-mannosidase
VDGCHGCSAPGIGKVHVSLHPAQPTPAPAPITRPFPPPPFPPLLGAQVVPLVTYTGPYPTQPLTPATAAPFNITVRVRFAPALAHVSGSVSVSGSWGGSASTHAVLTASPPRAPGLWTETEVAVTMTAAGVSLWWPAGMGEQAMYQITAVWAPDDPTLPPASLTVPVGFRVFYLVTDDDTDPARIAGVDGSGNLTMRWRVNGASVWSRGADIIPLEVLEGRQTAEAYGAMVASAVAGGFNTLRIDGIDEYFPEALYAATDAAGLMVYADVQYSQAQPAPQNTTAQDAELRYQVGGGRGREGGGGMGVFGPAAEPWWRERVWVRCRAVLV